MSVFEIYFRLGFKHISDFSGYDHILFIVALCSPYVLKYWNQILVLVTAFTIGHSITLGVATFGFLPIRSEIIEFLIPITIFLTCLFNIISKSESSQSNRLNINYALALIFGFIHGMGFSNYLRALLGAEESIFTPLLAFNVGLEIGQILIVSIVLGVTFLVMRVFKIVHRKLNLVVSGVAAGISILLMSEAKFW